jgi:hypothetical protein
MAALKVATVVLLMATSLLAVDNPFVGKRMVRPNHDADIPPTLIIEVFEKDGLTFYTPHDGWKVSVHFDGKRYSDQGPNTPQGTTTSAKRIDARTIEFVGETNGQPQNTATQTVSEDGKTTTLIISPVDSDKEMEGVYDRQ